MLICVSHLSLGERGLHVLQQAGQILLAVTHHQKQTETGRHIRNDHDGPYQALGIHKQVLVIKN